MTTTRSSRHATVWLLGLALVLLVPGPSATAAPCPPPARLSAPHSADCPHAVGAVITPRGYPTRGGTITVHSGEGICAVRLSMSVILCAGGDTAPGTNGRAIFRVSGIGPDSPGGLNIVATASLTQTPSAPELVPELSADAVVRLPPDAQLWRLADPATGRFTPVPDGHIRFAGLYKVLSRGVPLIPAPAPPALPSTLPATGGSPFGPLLALAALLILAGLWLGRNIVRIGRRSDREGPATIWRGRVGVVLLVAGLALAGSTGLAYAYMATRPSTPGFGSLTADAGAAPRDHAPRAAPTRLVIARLGIDTTVLPLEIAGGSWQVPAYAAGYLAEGLPQDSGNTVITGHDDRDGAVFRRLDELRAGDVVQVYRGTRSERYTVTAMHVVPATRTDVLSPTRGAILTLITCTPYLIDSQRLVVRARLVAGPA